jgi:hypothetical protein
MKRAIVFMIPIVLLALYGLSITNNSYTYEGENESWAIEYKITFYEAQYESTLIASYKGDEAQLSPEKNVTISYLNNSSGGTIIKRFNEETYILTSSGESEGVGRNNDVINVAISIGGKTQNIELKKAI